MVKAKTQELEGAALDYAVSVCENIDFKQRRSIHGTFMYKPSSDWSQGGPIIEREWDHVKFPYNVSGPYLLQEWMRCYVVSKIGEEVDIPEELL